MTMTIDRAAALAPRRHTATTPPNYLLRRFMAAIAVAGLAVVAVALLAATLAGFGGAPAVASEATPASAAVHVARSGDTLWSIAGEHHGDVDHRRYLDALIDLNGGTSIQAGQAVFLP